MSGPAKVLQRRAVLAAEPRSAGQARGTVRDLLTHAGLEGLADEATLLVSEVVTNAVLHAATRIELVCKLETGRLCVEVRDRSPVLPGRRHYHDDAMTGRGLGLVEQLASAWGVEPDSTGGKTVWFELVADDAADELLARAHCDPAGQAQQFTLRLRGVPAKLLATTLQYGDTLLRELVFASLSEEGEDASWQAPHIDLAPVLDAVRAAAGGGVACVDVDVALPAGSGSAAFQRLTLIEEADQMAREGLLLTIPELPEVSACRRWLLQEIAAQEDGTAPVPWSLPDPPGPLPSVAAPARQHRAHLDQLDTPALIADEANRILYANADAEGLLGWEPRALNGRRLITIVPHRLREAHLAGFGRFMLTREPRLIGQQVDVPALRQDGSEIPVALTITLLDVGAGPLTFLAVFTDRSVAS